MQRREDDMSTSERSPERQALAGREHGAQAEHGREREASEQLAGLKTATAGWQQAAEQRHDRQMVALDQRLDQKRTELKRTQQAAGGESRPAAGQGRRAEFRRAPERDAEADVPQPAAERDAFEQSAAAQRDALEAVREVERRVLAEQAARIGALEAGQQQERRAAAGQGPEATRQLDERHRAEAAALADRARAEIRALDEHRSLSNARIAQEQGRMEAALYTRGSDISFRQAAEDADARQKSSRQALDRRVSDQLAEIGRHFEHGPERGQSETARFGDLKPYSEQDRAIREQGVRKSEHEHIRARINLVLQTIDPVSGRSVYDQAAYRRSATLTIPRDMAMEKTRGDLALRDRLKAAIGSGKFTPQLARDISVEAEIQRTIAARDRTIDARLAEGRAVDDLKAITDDVIARATAYQQGELFDVGKGQRSPIRGASAADVDAAFEMWREES
jgi:hypothetical protein